MDPKTNNKMMVTVRWFQNVNGSWYGLLRQEEATKMGLANKRVKLFGKPPKNLVNGEIWETKILESKYYFNRHLSSMKQNEIYCSIPVDAKPLKKYHPNAKKIVKKAITESKQKTQIGLFSKHTDTFNDQYQVYSEIRTGSCPLSRLWRVFENENLIGSFTEYITMSVVASANSKKTLFEVTDLNGAIHEFGQPQFFHLDEGKLGAIWIDENGSSIVTSIREGTLFKKTSFTELITLSIEGYEVFGELRLYGLTNEPIQIKARLAYAERVYSEYIIPAKFTESLEHLSQADQDRVVQFMCEQGFIAHQDTHQEDVYLAVLTKFRRQICQANKLVRRGQREKNLSLIKIADERIKKALRTLNQALSTDLNYALEPNAQLYKWVNPNIEKTQKIQAYAKRLKCYHDISAKKIASILMQSLQRITCL
ncbi:hypothetical protein IT408_04620 [Candidatus Uhrbacteria bacterium]|nr:hypothetical protein [Candidatus Uhrbacteria bacterium]